MEVLETAEEREVIRGVAEIFAALGDPTRLTVMVRLAAGGTFSIAELAEGSGLSRQAVTRHLKVLEEAGLVLGGAHGREKLYELDIDPLHEARGCLDMVCADWDRAAMMKQEAATGPRRRRFRTK